MNWPEMTPRERDALVAEKVMGFTTFDDNDCTIESEKGNPWRRFFVPTRRIDLAFEVVEKMRGEGWRSHHTQNEIGGPVTWKFSKGTEIVSATAAGDPEAICLAALRARGVDV